MEIINWCKSSSWADCQTVQEYKSEILVWFWGVFCFILQFPCLFATDNLVDSRLFQMEELRTERIQVIVTEVCAFPLQFYTCRRGSWDCKSGCCFGRSTRCFYQHFLAVISTNTSMVTPTALVFSSSVQSLFYSKVQALSWIRPIWLIMCKPGTKMIQTSAYRIYHCNCFSWT